MNKKVEEEKKMGGSAANHRPLPSSALKTKCSGSRQTKQVKEVKSNKEEAERVCCEDVQDGQCQIDFGSGEIGGGSLLGKQQLIAAGLR